MCSKFNLSVDETVNIVRGGVAASSDRGVVMGKAKKVYSLHIMLINSLELFWVPAAKTFKSIFAVLLYLPLDSGVAFI
jgi:hypothetical protein